MTKNSLHSWRNDKFPKRGMGGVSLILTMMTRLKKYDIVALVTDGKAFGDDEIIISIGVTIKGEKVILGIIQAASENAFVCKDFLRGLINRGLKYEQGFLCVIDGAKGFRKTIDDVFGNHGVVQRCQSVGRVERQRNPTMFKPFGSRESRKPRLSAEPFMCWFQPVFDDCCI